MKIRPIVGLVLSIMGIIMLIYAGYIFNELFFKIGLTKLENLPIYGQYVIPFMLIGLLSFIDGLTIVGLKRGYVLLIYLIFNVIWVYATFLLLQFLAIPILNASEYSQIFYLFFFAFIVLLIGVVINNFPRK
ncbi:MAG: hypothetical protein QXE19_02180, partial [Candidatus Bathyarchaeia archaeon]